MKLLSWLRGKLAPSLNIHVRDVKRILDSTDSAKAEAGKHFSEIETKLRDDDKLILHRIDDLWRLTRSNAAQLDRLSLEQYLQRPDAALAPRSGNGKIVVSLTSYPARIGTVARPILSMLRQSMKPDRIILWLSREQFPYERLELPYELILLESVGLEIRFCDGDLKAHKKYFYAFSLCPEDLIITVDDDLDFDGNLIETLYSCHQRFPKAVVAVRTHELKLENGKILPYNDWGQQTGEPFKPSLKLCATTGAGTLYPPHCLPKQAFDDRAIKELCLDADDLWLKVMELITNTPVVLARPVRKLNVIPDTQGASLWSSNRERNDEQLGAVLGRYNEVFGKSDTLISRIK